MSRQSFDPFYVYLYYKVFYLGALKSHRARFISSHSLHSPLKQSKPQRPPKPFPLHRIRFRLTSLIRSAKAKALAHRGSDCYGDAARRRRLVSRLRVRARHVRAVWARVAREAVSASCHFFYKYHPSHPQFRFPFLFDTFR